MFVLTTVTRDCKNGDLYVSVDDNAYLTKEAASAALRARYEDFLKSMELEDNGASDENGNAMPGGYCISDEASIYDYADYANCQLLPIVVITTKEIQPVMWNPIISAVPSGTMRIERNCLTVFSPEGKSGASYSEKFPMRNRWKRNVCTKS